MSNLKHVHYEEGDELKCSISFFIELAMNKRLGDSRCVARLRLDFKVVRLAEGRIGHCDCWKTPLSL
jgi:hypothetical protein